MSRTEIEAVLTKWERWAAREMWISEHLHPRAKQALVVALTEALCSPEKPAKGNPFIKPAKAKGSKQ